MAKENKGKPRGNGLQRVITGDAEAAQTRQRSPIFRKSNAVSQHRRNTALIQIELLTTVNASQRLTRRLRTAISAGKP
jgi:hypothetical protein